MAAQLLSVVQSKRSSWWVSATFKLSASVKSRHRAGYGVFGTRRELREKGGIDRLTDSGDAEVFGATRVPIVEGRMVAGGIRKRFGIPRVRSPAWPPRRQHTGRGDVSALRRAAIRFRRSRSQVQSLKGGCSLAPRSPRS